MLRVSRANLSTRVVALAMAAVAPWTLSLFLMDGLSQAGAALAAACAVLSGICCLLIARVLAPIRRTAVQLRELAIADGAEIASFHNLDEIGLFRSGIAHLTERLRSIQHRWTWRHGLTGLPVRETLLAAMSDDLARSHRPAFLGAIRLVDYNRLLAFDPPTADAALQRFSERLTATLGKARPMAHVDRDCFAIWFRGAEPNAAAVELKALCYALGGEIVAGGMRLDPDIELGAAHYPEDATEPAALINHALASLARPNSEKSDAAPPGRSASIAKERYSLEQDLGRAIEREQLEMVYQPVVDLTKGIIGAEALLRWRHPDAGMISPVKFIPILEDADLIDEIGRWTLNAACRERRRWQQQGLRHLKVAVNLSAAQLRDPGLKLTIERTLDRHRLPASALELELTETAATQDAERTFALFSQLRALGVSLAIDDFGSGYSSLSYLKNLPFDKLKVDREFVVDVHLRRDSQAICRSLVELTRGLDIAILAEGVESWAEVEMLREFGCTTFQGFLFSEPVNPDQFIEIALDPIWRGPLTQPKTEPDQMGESRMTA
jgi:EAL domain-containing protein (putative c-di-GMP-specific phosphodiesterase class I)/GGDEF domain-containing protein